jgi:Polyketide cyclase / dehydrase and lipid transport
MPAPLQWRTQITVSAPKDRVWAIADDITLIPQYHPEVRHVELIRGGRSRAAGVRYRCTIPEGRRGSCVEEITECVPGSRFVTAFPEDSWGLSRQFDEFTVETLVETVPEGTRIRLSAYYRPRTLLMRLLNPLGLRQLMARRALRVLAGVKRLAERQAGDGIADRQARASRGASR